MSTDLLRIALLIAYTATSVVGMVLLKGAEALISVKGLIGFALYLAGFLIWVGVILRLMPLSQAFPMAAGSLMLGTQLAGWLLLNERVGFVQLGGVAFILVGVVIVGAVVPVKQ